MAITYGLPGGKTHTLYSNARTLVTPGTTLLRASVDVSAPSTVTSYLFSHTPDVEPLPPTNETHSLSAASDSWDSWDFSLLPGSSVSVDYACDYNVGFYIVRGDSNYEKWEDHLTGYEYHHYGSSGSGVASEPAGSGRAVTWHFIWDNSALHTVSGTATFDLKLVTYSLTSPKPLASATGDGTFPLSMGSSEVLILATGDLGTGDVLAGVFFHSRWGAYAGLLAFMCLVCVALVACFWRRDTRRLKALSAAPESAALLTGAAATAAPAAPQPYVAAPAAAAAPYVAQPAGSAAAQQPPPPGAALPPGWEMCVDENGQTYFKDHVNATTSWDPPRM